jgi:O-methyltransferase involved in polyketide biosynthesis
MRGQASGGVEPVQLTGVPETLLWTLHNRASEAIRPDGILRDEACLRIYRRIDYPYERSFGPAEPSHAVRSVAFDAAIRGFAARHPNAVIVNLGEGLETQRFRLADLYGLSWISVDLAEAIAVRERFIEPDARHLHVTGSALDSTWFDAVPSGRPVFVAAQGLFMYFTTDAIGGLVQDVVRRWPGVELMFDHVPRWLSRKSLSRRGWYRTRHYRVPPLPWGVNRSELAPLLRSWAGAAEVVSTADYRFPRGPRRMAGAVLHRIGWAYERIPGMIHVRLG